MLSNSLWFFHAVVKPNNLLSWKSSINVRRKALKDYAIYNHFSLDTFNLQVKNAGMRLCTRQPSDSQVLSLELRCYLSSENIPSCIYKVQRVHVPSMYYPHFDFRFTMGAIFIWIISTGWEHGSLIWCINNIVIIGKPWWIVYKPNEVKI
jgi:hypothetical protein